MGLGLGFVGEDRVGQVASHGYSPWNGPLSHARRVPELL
jgi:hypothetical protein